MDDHMDHVVVVHVHGGQFGALLFSSLFEEFCHIFGLLFQKFERILHVPSD